MLEGLTRHCCTSKHLHDKQNVLIISPSVHPSSVAVPLIRQCSVIFHRRCAKDIDASQLALTSSIEYGDVLREIQGFFCCTFHCGNLRHQNVISLMRTNDWEKNASDGTDFKTKEML